MRYYHRFANDAIGLVRDRFESYGDIYYVANGSGGLYVSHHPDHIRDVLVTHGSRFGKAHSAFAKLARVLGQGLLNTDGATWKRSTSEPSRSKTSRFRWTNCEPN